MGPRPRKLQLLRWIPGGIVKSRGSARDAAIYLTFDDGPHPEHTPRVLDLLARHGARGSFFVIGDKVTITGFPKRDDPNHMSINVLVTGAGASVKA